MSHYKHLTIEEREKAIILIALGNSFRIIAKALNRAASTLSREFKRNVYANGTYSPNHAQKLYQKRKLNCGITPIFRNQKIQDYVLEKLKIGWSPEQIVGREKYLNNEYLFSISTIYRAVDKKILPKGTKKLMRFKWKYRKSKILEEKRGKIPNRNSIHNRPEEINNKKEIGHWESDTIIGKRKTGCIGTHVERKTGYLVAIKLEDRKDNVFNIETEKVFKKMPKELKGSFTVDNGKEFTEHEKLSEETGMEIYFCDANAPWQKGLNENTNGLLRYFYPKGSSFKNITQASLGDVVELLNDRPRKRFDYKTPKEMLLKELTSVALNVQT